MSNVSLIDHYKAVRARMGMAARRPVAAIPPRSQPVVDRPVLPSQIATPKQPGNRLLRPWNQPRPRWSTKRVGVPVFVVQCMVADYYGVSRDDIVGRRRIPKIALPRHICIYLCRKLSNRSYPELSVPFHRHHATIINSVQRVERLMSTRKDVAQDIERLTFLLTGEQPFIYWGA